MVLVGGCARPTHRDNLFVAAGTQSWAAVGEISRHFHQRRGLGHEPWAAKTSIRDTGNIGPKTYAKIFELLLRLKANTLWPAMHEVSTAFNADSRKQASWPTDYGIVMGSSHAEPMLRNNVGEWPKDNQAAYNFVTNPEGVTKYWEERVRPTASMRTSTPSACAASTTAPMPGAARRGPGCRALEANFRRCNAGCSPNMSTPIRPRCRRFSAPTRRCWPNSSTNLQVPPDVTVVFPDDNFGYIRYFPTPEQIAARPGGFGVYYHSEYLGAPLSYAWLDTTPPALIWEEMSKAYDHDMQKFWMLNVGGLKPA